MHFDGVEEAHFSEKLKHKFFSRIHTLSGGNVGFGLLLWQANLLAEDKENINLAYPAIVEFPELSDTSWHYLLLQLYLHKSLTRQQLERLFNHETNEWIDHICDELYKSQIIEKHAKDLFILKPEFRHYLEKWRKEKELI